MIHRLLEILFVGHSLIGVTMPALLDEAIANRHQGVSVSAQIINGAPLRWNWEHSSEAQGVDARQVLPRGKTDVLVITEAVPLRGHATSGDSNENAYAFYDLAVSSNPDTRVYMFETWHSLKSGTGVDVEYDDDDQIPWRERLDTELSRWEGIVDYVNAKRSPDQPEMLVIPGGQAMARLSDAIAAKTVPGITDISQVYSDDIHLNFLGNYYIAMVHYAAIFQESPVGLRVSQKFLNTGTSAGLETRLQELAWETVTTYPRSGVKQRAAIDIGGPQKRSQSAPSGILPQLARPG